MSVRVRLAPVLEEARRLGRELSLAPTVVR
jgi:hypothetical protein